MSKYVLYYQHEQHTVHLIVYHIIWCPKSRRKVLLGDLAHRLELIIQEVAKEHTWEIIRVAVQPDHVHLFIRSNPSIMPTDIAWTIFSCAQGRVSHVAEA